MFVNVQIVISFVLVAFISIFSLNVNALVHRLMIQMPNNQPEVKDRFSINNNSNDNNNNNGSIASSEVINHVRHKHEQTIGNVHIVTNIDIANLITILNMSAPVSGQSIDVPSTTITAVPATILPGKLCTK